MLVRISCTSASSPREAPALLCGLVQGGHQIDDLAHYVGLLTDERTCSVRASGASVRTADGRTRLRSVNGSVWWGRCDSGRASGQVQSPPAARGRLIRQSATSFRNSSGARVDVPHARAPLRHDRRHAPLAQRRPGRTWGLALASLHFTRTGGEGISEWQARCLAAFSQISGRTKGGRRRGRFGPRPLPLQPACVTSGTKSSTPLPRCAPLLLSPVVHALPP
jgi:hypothetical protein